MEQRHLSIVGANTRGDREEDDFYPTPAYATEALLKREKFDGDILEPACGDGAISKVLEQKGYKVDSYDLIDRGYGKGGVNFFFLTPEKQYGAVITNPPYKHALKFVQKALTHITAGGKVAFLLKLVFLEGAERYNFFQTNPPRKIYVFSRRLTICKNGVETKNSGMMAFAWFVWENGYKGKPEVEWICD